MEINAYLPFDGRCDEAFALYAQVLGGEIVMRMTYGGSPMADQFPPDFAGKVMHARIALAGQMLFGSDSPPGRYEPPRGVSISIGVTDMAEAERVFAGLSEGATIHMPLQQTFWAAGFGMLVDRFGIAWMVNCEAAPS